MSGLVDPGQLTLVMLSRLFPWRQALTIVKPATFIGWHRQGFRLFWKRKSRPRERPRIPAELQKLIMEMGNDNPAWGGAAKLVGVLAGESPAGGTCPVAPVVISGGGEGDQSAGSPEVKILVGWVKTRSAPTGG